MEKNLGGKEEEKKKVSRKRYKAEFEQFENLSSSI